MISYTFPPVIKQPSIIPHFLVGDDASDFLKEFNQLVDADFNSNSTLRVLNLKEINGVPTIVGSNPLVLPLVQRLIGSRYRVARPEDIQRTLNDGDTLGIRNKFCIDLGLVLDFSGKNREMTYSLNSGQLRDLVYSGSLPRVIVGYDICSFTNKRGERDKLGLVFNDQSQSRILSFLTGSNFNFNNADVSLETGLPTRLGNGVRELHIDSQKLHSLDTLGISRLYLGADLGLFASTESLDYSIDCGRIVLIENTPSGGKAR